MFFCCFSFFSRKDILNILQNTDESQVDFHPRLLGVLCLPTAEIDCRHHSPTGIYLQVLSRAVVLRVWSLPSSNRITWNLVRNADSWALPKSW